MCGIIDPELSIRLKLVAPAQAGIQFFEHSLRSGATSRFSRSSKLAASGSFCPLRGIFFLLDSLPARK